MTEMRTCEKCGTALTEKTELDLLSVLHKNSMDAVPEMVQQAFNAFKYVYNCGCPMNLAKLEEARKKEYYFNLKKKAEEFK